MGCSETDRKKSGPMEGCGGSPMLRSERRGSQSDGKKVQNVRFLNSESNAGAFRSGNKQFPTGYFHLQGHKRR